KYRTCAKATRLEPHDRVARRVDKHDSVFRPNPVAPAWQDGREVDPRRGAGISGRLSKPQISSWAFLPALGLSEAVAILAGYGSWACLRPITPRRLSQVSIYRAGDVSAYLRALLPAKSFSVPFYSILNCPLIFQCGKIPSCGRTAWRRLRSSR